MRSEIAGGEQATQLGHSQAATTQRYAHLASDPLNAAAATVPGKIAAAMEGNSAKIMGFDDAERA